MKHARRTEDTAKIRRAIDDDLITINTDINPHDLPAIKVRPGSEQEYLNAVDALVKESCNPVTLGWALRLGFAMRTKPVPSVPPAERVRRVLKKLESLAVEIDRLEKCGFLMVINREETLKLWQEKHVDFGEVNEPSEALPHLFLQRWLHKKADMYKRWLKLASKRVPPKTGTLLTRVHYLLPAYYVRQVTGKACAAQLVKLFDTVVGINIDEAQLSRELKQLMNDYRGLRSTFKVMLDIVKVRDFC
jgi:hypothetical protein